MLDEGNHEYRTFKLPDAKTLGDLLRGITQIFALEEIKQNLIDMGFGVVAISRV